MFSEEEILCSRVYISVSAKGGILEVCYHSFSMPFSFVSFTFSLSYLATDVNF